MEVLLPVVRACPGQTGGQKLSIFTACSFKPGAIQQEANLDLVGKAKLGFKVILWTSFTGLPHLISNIKR